MIGLNYKERLIVALDFPNWDQALALVDQLPEVIFYKVGLELFLAEGQRAVADLKARGKKVFLDLKFHDIPNTVAQACCRASNFGADIINLHALGGEKMMTTAASEMSAYAKDQGITPPALIAVTILTSMAQEDLTAIGLKGTPTENVVTLAASAHRSGLQGVVASPKEIRDIREALGQDFLIISPGIRPGGSDLNDQQRTLTPKEAIIAGADYLVVGRPITKAADPAAAAAAVLAEIAQGLELYGLE